MFGHPNQPRSYRVPFGGERRFHGIFGTRRRPNLGESGRSLVVPTRPRHPENTGSGLPSDSPSREEASRFNRRKYAGRCGLRNRLPNPAGSMSGRRHRKCAGRCVRPSPRLPNPAGSMSGRQHRKCAGRCVRPSPRLSNPAGSMNGRQIRKCAGRCANPSRLPNHAVRASHLNSGTCGGAHSRRGGSERCQFATRQPGGSDQQSGQNALIQPTEPLQIVHNDPLIDFVDGGVEGAQFNDLSTGRRNETAIRRAATGG